MYGFTMAYRETGDARFLATARKVTDWYLAHLPSDFVPYWDFNAPNIPNEPRDTSAASIAASGLLELSQLETDAARKATYLNAAKNMLTSLSSPAYLAEGTTNEAVLLHGTQHKPAGKFDTGLIWGDYYFLEAMLRYRSIVPAGTPLSVAAVTASANDGNVPANTLDNNLATRWAAQGDGQWIRYDLGSSQTITKVSIAWYKGNERASRFDIQTSPDGTTWTTAFSGLSSGTTLQPETYDFADRPARHVRILGHGNSLNAWNSITEVDIYSAGPIITPTPTNTPTNTPTPRPSTRSEAESCTLSQAIVANNHAGFSGTGFVDYTNVTGSYIECTVSAAQAGSANLAIRFANGSTTNRPMNISVNGTVVASNLAFNPTGAWSTWQTTNVTVALNAGTNLIRATATTAGGGPNVDYFETS